MAEISVIIPVYNSGLWLEECLTSVLNQSFKDIEIICVDDGSTDNSRDILEKYRQCDNRIRIIDQKNTGAGAARNNGMRQAKGNYLSFLDSDDFYEPAMLEKAYGKARECRADFVVFNSDQYNTNERAFVKVPWVVRFEDIPPYEPFKYRQLTDNVFMVFVGWAWDKLYRHSFVKEQNLWFQEQKTTNDMLFVFSALITAKRIAVVKEVLAHQRKGNNKSLSRNREKSWFCFFDALIALRERIIKEGIYNELEQDFINYALHFSLWNLNTLAEPAHTELKEKLRRKWFYELGIVNQGRGFFYNQREFAQYLEIIN